MRLVRRGGDLAARVDGEVLFYGFNRSLIECNMDAVRYKEFCIVVKVQLEANSKNRFQVVSEISASSDERQLVRTWATVQEFASEKAAYEFGLQQARAWIDEHAHD